MYVSETIKIIREYFVKKLNFSQNQIIIIYGGSVNKLNAKKLLKIMNLMEYLLEDLQLMLIIL